MLLLTYAALVAQVSLGDSLSIRGVPPDFLALAVVGATFLHRGASAVAWGAMAGLLADCVDSTRLGLHMLFATLLVAFVQSFIGTEWRKSAVAQTWIGFVVVFAMLSGPTVVEMMLNRQTIVFPTILPALAATAVYSAAVGLALRTIWKSVAKLIPARSPDSRVLGSGRWDALNR
jgi:rod shape-determining protein MreD